MVLSGSSLVWSTSPSASLERKAWRSFLRLDGSVWTTDKDRIIPCLLAAEIIARMGRDPGDVLANLRANSASGSMSVSKRQPTCAKGNAGETSKRQVHTTDLAGEKIQNVRTEAPGNGALIGGLKVVAESSLRVRPVARISIRGNLPRKRSSAPHPGGNAEHREGGVDRGANSPPTAGIFSPAIYSCNQPPVKPARRKPIWMAGHCRIKRQRNPVR